MYPCCLPQFVFVPPKKYIFICSSPCVRARLPQGHCFSQHKKKAKMLLICSSPCVRARLPQGPFSLTRHCFLICSSPCVWTWLPQGLFFSPKYDFLICSSPCVRRGGPDNPDHDHGGGGGGGGGGLGTVIQISVFVINKGSPTGGTRVSYVCPSRSRNALGIMFPNLCWDALGTNERALVVFPDWRHRAGSRHCPQMR